MERTLHDHPRQVLTVPGDSLLPDFANYVASREANEADIARALTETGAAAIAAGSPEAAAAIISGGQHIATRNVLKHSRAHENL